VLQHEIRKTHARNQKVEWVDDLVLMETIGKGGFGVVYKGSWKGSLAAIKVGSVILVLLACFHTI
jgi:predicted Ser/Thr protein kinase